MGLGCEHGIQGLLDERQLQTWKALFNRPGLAGAVLQTPLSLIESHALNNHL